MTPIDPSIDECSGPALLQCLTKLKTEHDRIQQVLNLENDNLLAQRNPSKMKND